jgi:hypothetical protein
VGIISGLGHRCGEGGRVGKDIKEWARGEAKIINQMQIKPLVCRLDNRLDTMLYSLCSYCE